MKRLSMIIKEGKRWAMTREIREKKGGEKELEIELMIVLLEKKNSVIE